MMSTAYIATEALENLFMACAGSAHKSTCERGLVWFTCSVLMARLQNEPAPDSLVISV